MASLKPCKACGNMIAKDAKVCPSCGAKNKRGGGCGVVIVALIVIIAIGAAVGTSKSTPAAAAKPVPAAEKQQPEAANPVLADALAYLRKVDGVCRVDIVRYDVFLSFANNELPTDYKLVANAAAMNGSRALVAAGETPSRCSVWVIPAGDPAKVDNAYYSTTARNGRAQ